MRFFAASCSALACAFGASIAGAQASQPPAVRSEPPSSKPATEPSAQPNSNAPAPVRNTVAGHFVAGGAGGFIWPLGRLDGRHLPADYFAPGEALNLDLGYGLSRYIVVGAWGELDSYGAPSRSRCPTCSGSGSGFAAGPFIRYHLVQGTRFDPWASFAVGYRSLNESAANASYSGVEWGRIMLGGDFYPWSNFGFGPYLTMDLGSYGSHPAADGNASNKLFLNLATGLRVVVDFPGK